MMDAMKVQQIGKLAAELVSHGQAPDIQTAMMQAECMLSKDSQIPLNNQAQMFQQGNGNSQGVNPQTGFLNPGPSPGDSTDYALEIRRLQRQLEESKRTVVELKSAVASMMGNMEQIVQKLAKVEEKQKPVMLEKTPETGQTHLKQETVKPNPRVGNWNPGDVAIENIFYSGPK